MLIMLVAPAKPHFEEQALIAGTKQRKQAGWLKRHSGLPALCLLLAPLFFEVHVLQANMS